MIKRFVAGLLMAVAAGLAMAQTPEGAVVDTIAQKFRAMYPNTRFQAIRPSRIPGIYELVMGNNVAYADESGRYFIFGHLYDMQEQVDLTAKGKQQTVRKTEFPAQHLANAIKKVKGDGSRVLAVFSDPDCPYCKTLERELLRLDNVTIYTFLYPLESIHPEAKTKAVSVWCAGDRAQAWQTLMLSGEGPRLQACKNPINENLTLGSRLGVTGTPTLIAADGRILPGAAPAERIDQWLGGAVASKADDAKASKGDAQ